MSKHAKVDAGRLLAADLPEAPAWLAFNARGTRLAAACWGGDYAVVLNTATGREVARVADITLQDQYAFEFYKTGLLGLRGREVVCCNLSNGAVKTLWAEEGLHPQSARLSPDGRLLAAGVGGGVVVVDLVKKKSRRMTGGNPSASFGPQFSPGSRYVAADLFSRAYPGADYVAVWDTATGRRWRVFETSGTGCGSPPKLAFRGDTLALAVSDMAGVSFFEPDQGVDPAVSCSLPDIPLVMRFQDGGATLAVVGYGGALTLVEAATGQVLRREEPPAGHEVGYCVPNADWSLLAGGMPEGILVWPSGQG